MHDNATRGAFSMAERLRAMSDWSEEETDNAFVADERNFYKVEKWTRDGNIDSGASLGWVIGAAVNSVTCSRSNW
jgi:hypothetical protein